MGWFIIGFLAIAGIAIFVGISKANKAGAKSDDISKRYPGAKVYVSTDDFSYCAVDFDAERLILGRIEPQFMPPRPAYEKEYPFSQIAKVEVVRDGATVSSTNRGSQAVGAAVGALALGGIGAVIGGLSGSSTSHDRIRRLAVAVHVDDREIPVHEILFLKSAGKKGDKPDGMLAAPAVQKAQEVAAHIANAMRAAAQKTAVQSVRFEASAQPAATAIKELWDLKEIGAITSEEFESEKRRLLGGPLTPTLAPPSPGR